MPNRHVTAVLGVFFSSLVDEMDNIIHSDSLLPH